MLRQTDQKTLLHAAFLEAADHIEAHPERYDFQKGWRKPRSMEGFGCMLAWVGYFFGLNEGTPREYSDDVAKLLGFRSDDDFFRALLRGGIQLTDAGLISPTLCAQGMRAYAREYLS